MIITTRGDGVGGGLFQEGDELVKIEKAVIHPEYDSDTNYHTGLRAELSLEDGRERVVEGRVMGYIPLRNRRAGSNTTVGEGMTEYTLDGERKGYGLSEFLDQND